MPTCENGFETLADNQALLDIDVVVDLDRRAFDRPSVMRPILVLVSLIAVLAMAFGSFVAMSL